VAVRQVLRYPHAALKAVAAAAPIVDAGDTERVACDLLDTMTSFGHCVGLAATQLGELTRIVVVDVSDHPKATTSHGLLLLANPRVVAQEGGEVAREGCLSIPQLTADVRRATHIGVEADAISIADDGFAIDRLALETDGFEARCLLHEIDHLDGILFLDRVESLTRDVFRRKQYR
jgi:peptide deformylase